MAEENKLNQTPEITPAPSAEAPEKAPTTGELLGDVEHYDEEKDDYKIPKGWWEDRHFCPDDVYNNVVDFPVVGWMPLPPKEVTQNGNQQENP